MIATKQWHCECGEIINPGEEFKIIAGTFLKSGHTHGNTEEEIQYEEKRLQQDVVTAWTKYEDATQTAEPETIQLTLF